MFSTMSPWMRGVRRPLAMTELKHTCTKACAVEANCSEIQSSEFRGQTFRRQLKAPTEHLQEALSCLEEFLRINPVFRDSDTDKRLQTRVRSRRGGAGRRDAHRLHRLKVRMTLRNEDRFVYSAGLYDLLDDSLDRFYFLVHQYLSSDFRQCRLA